MGWFGKLLETPDQTAERHAEEAERRAQDRYVDALETDRSRSFWRTWADT